MTDQVSLLWQFLTDLTHSSRWSAPPSPELLAALDRGIDERTITWQPGTEAYRGQCHPCERLETPRGPFSADDLAAPPGPCAPAQRFNPAGIGVLYLASTAEVAALECRATTGDYVTIARLRSQRPLRLFDGRTACQERQSPDALFETVTSLLSAPNDPEKNAETHLFCHWLADYLQHHRRLDGLLYDSSIRSRNDGRASRTSFNLCAFDPEGWTVLEDSPELFRIAQVDVRLEGISCRPRP